MPIASYCKQLSFNQKMFWLNERDHAHHIAKHIWRFKMLTPKEWPLNYGDKRYWKRTLPSYSSLWKFQCVLLTISKIFSNLTPITHSDCPIRYTLVAFDLSCLICRVFWDYFPNKWCVICSTVYFPKFTAAPICHFTYFPLNTLHWYSSINRKSNICIEGLDQSWIDL